MNKIIKRSIISFIVFFGVISSIAIAGNGDNVENVYADFVIAFSIIIVSIMFFFWKIYGKDTYVNEMVEFYPPEDYNSAEVGFFYRGYADTKSVISLLLYLANKGYLKIEASESERFRIIKLKDYDGDKNIEKLFFEGLFKKNSDVIMGKDFYQKLAIDEGSLYSLVLLIKEFNKYREQKDVLNQSKIELKDSNTFSELYNNFLSTLNEIKRKLGSKNTKRVIFENNSIEIRKIIIVFMLIIFLLITIKPCFEAGLTNLLVILFFTGMGFFVMFRGIYDTIFDIDTMQMYWFGRPTNDPSLRISVSVFVGVFFGGLPWFFMVLPYLTMVEGYLKMYIIGIISLVILMLFFYIMPRRTKYGNKLLAKIDGFKNFIERAEKEQFEKLIMENPNYFYEILPYAYAIDVFDILFHKFESININPPIWYEMKENFCENNFKVAINETMYDALEIMTADPSANN